MHRNLVIIFLNIMLLFGASALLSMLLSGATALLSAWNTTAGAGRVKDEAQGLFGSLTPDPSANHSMFG